MPSSVSTPRVQLGPSQQAEQNPVRCRGIFHDAYKVSTTPPTAISVVALARSALSSKRSRLLPTTATVGARLDQSAVLIVVGILKRRTTLQSAMTIFSVFNFKKPWVPSIAASVIDLPRSWRSHPRRLYWLKMTSSNGTPIAPSGAKGGGCVFDTDLYIFMLSAHCFK